jgi:hypothetical protein
MSIRSDLNFHLLQISDATIAAKVGFDGAKTYRQTLLDLQSALDKQINALTVILTGSDYLEDDENRRAADINLSFDLAEEERANDRHASRRAPYGIAVDRARM